MVSHCPSCFMRSPLPCILTISRNIAAQCLSGMGSANFATSVSELGAARNDGSAVLAGDLDVSLAALMREIYRSDSCRLCFIRTFHTHRIFGCDDYDVSHSPADVAEAARVL